MNATHSRSAPVRRRARSLAVLAAAVASLVVVAACGTEGDEPAGSPEAEGVPAATPVLATTSIWADVTEQVACGELEVPSMVPPGVDTHDFEPSVRDTDAVTRADLVVANGLGLEEGLTATLDAAAEAGATVVPVAEGLDLVEAGSDHAHEAGEDHDHETGEDHDHETGEDHDHGGVDPHVWMDPQRVAAAVPTIADALIEAGDTGLSAEQIEECAAAYVAELDQLGDELASTFDQLPPEGRRLVTDHESLGYLADGFGLEVIGTVIPSTSSLGESNPRELEELAAAMEAAGVTRIYAASTGASDVGAALGDRVGDGGGVQVVELYTESLGEAGGGADSYVSMMRVNAERISGR